MDSDTYNKINPHLHATSMKIFGYNADNPLPLLGKFSTTVISKVTDTSADVQFYVVHGGAGNLMSYQTATDPGLLHIVNSVSSSEASNNIIKQYDDRFHGLGKMKRKIAKLHINQEVKALAQKHKRIPFNLRDQVEADIRKLEELDIIEKAEGPTPWVSQIVIVPKKTVTDTSADVQFYVVHGGAGNLMSYQTATDLGLLDIVNSVSSSEASNNIIKQYDDRFHGLGKMKRKIAKLHINQEVKALAQKHKRIPFNLRDQVEADIRKLEELDIIEKAEGPTPWVSPIVIVPKKTGIRICVDMRAANEAIERERHPVPTIEDLIVDLNGSTVFSKIDLNQGYHQLELDNSSRSITTFATHLGLYRYKRLSFGINSASEIFQKAVEEALQGIPGARNISDDIIVFGKYQHDLDIALQAVLQRIRDCNLTANPDKCLLNQSSIDFFGHCFTAEGISLDQGKAESLLNACPPKNVNEARSSLGMAQYLSRFIKNFASISAPIRQLTCKDAKWVWGPQQQQAFDSLKANMIARPNLMKYFDPLLETELVVAASPNGLRAILTQVSPTNERHVIAYASRSLTDCESRYSQTAREALAAVWGVENFHLYLYGSTFCIATDHKPLEAIFNKKFRMKHQRTKHYNVYQKYYYHNNGISGHQGIVKTKCLLRESVWIPGMDRMVEEMVSQCIPCQVANHSSLPSCEPLSMSALPSGPWQELSIDFCGPFPGGDYLLVVVDDYSRYPEVEIPHPDSIFSRQGIPNVVRTDNGPPFNSQDFHLYATHLGFKHRKVTPAWPKANGEVERMMRTLEKAIRIAVIEHRSWKQELFTFLRQYRATPHSTTARSPSELLNGRKLKSTLPIHKQEQPFHDVRQTDANKTEKMKAYADKHNHAKHSDFEVGDRVLIKQPKHNKLSTPFCPEPLEITQKKGSMVTAQNADHSVTRNSSFFKKLPSNTPVSPNLNDCDDEIQGDLPTPVVHADESSCQPRRSSRIRRLPTHLKDYEL
ncbi:uncharacterized protein K02A2.6-like [Stylophora pistillata]|uniref:uncharacterized protein K02A2.6-like n=1 Tax=Stylophora pistillata TaxID=50429 RepID=UPI000C046D42|nr:uncharacterized protein K02A2.6-like [Stylophora pistillata]